MKGTPIKTFGNVILKNMNSKNILLFIFGFVLCISSCKEDEDIIDLGTPPAPNVLTNEISTGPTVVLAQENADDDFAVLSWTPSDFGGKKVNYSIEIDRAGNNFATAKDVITIKELKETLTVQDIN